MEKIKEFEKQHGLRDIDMVKWMFFGILKLLIGVFLLALIVFVSVPFTSLQWCMGCVETIEWRGVYFCILPRIIAFFMGIFISYFLGSLVFDKMPGK